jgi:hypothetical protein
MRLMEGNGQAGPSIADATVLRWPGRVLAADDLRRTLNGHREVLVNSQAVITPLALEHLRTKGVGVRRQERAGQPVASSRWGYAQEREHPLVQSAVQAIRREDLVLEEMKGNGGGSPGQWARDLALCVARGECRGGALFCQDPGLICCVANKVAGVRAVPVDTVGQAARAGLTLGANLLAVEMPGRTFFEIRQILRILCASTPAVCPPGVACTLTELDGHAHR